MARSQRKEKEEICDKLQFEIVSLRTELEKSIAHLIRSLKFGKGIEILDDIMNFQRSPNIKIGLGYDKNQKTPKENNVLQKHDLPHKDNNDKFIIFFPPR